MNVGHASFLICFEKGVKKSVSRHKINLHLNSNLFKSILFQDFNVALLMRSVNHSLCGLDILGQEILLIKLQLMHCVYMTSIQCNT